MSRTNVFAFDRSARRIDANGHLHVAACRISKAVVNTYLGRELPDWQRLGVQADRAYKMYRTPELLASIAGSFENAPLLLNHVPVSADRPAQELICGTVSNVRWADPYLVADVTLWRADAIKAIESGERKEISCAYRYTVDMTPGVLESTPFDGRMVPPGAANHVALVEAGRAGRDVVVADSARSPVPKVADLFPSLRNVRRF